MRKVTLVDLQKTVDVHLGQINALMRRVTKLENTVAGHKAEIALLKKRKPSRKPMVIAPYDKPYSVRGEI